MNQKVSTETIAEFQERVLTYWNKYGRRNLPCRHTNDPWKLLIAEILLGKTMSWQVAKVYRQLSAFSPDEIARMNLSALEKILQPIGLYKVRASQLNLLPMKLLSKYRKGLIPFNPMDFFVLYRASDVIRDSVNSWSFGTMGLNPLLEQYNHRSAEFRITSLIWCAAVPMVGSLPGLDTYKIRVI